MKRRKAATAIVLAGLGLISHASAQAPVIAPGQSLTLDQVVSLAVNNNSSAQLALERLKKSQELIEQVNAETRPQISANLTDTLSSNRTFGTNAANIQSPTLPGGGQIPVITDQGGGNTATFTSGGGGGNAASSGSISAPQSTAVTTPTSTRGTTSAPAPIGNSTGAGLTALPRILQQYATVKASRPADTTTGTGTGGGSGTGTGAFTTGVSNRNGGYYNNYSGRITVTEYLDFFHVAATARSVEEITRDFYRTDLERVANEIALTAKNDFFNVLRAQAQVSVQLQQVTADAESVRIAQARFAAGAAPQYDVLTAQTTLSNAQQLLSQDQNTLNLDKADLNNLIEIDPGSSETLVEPPLPPLNVTYNAPQLNQAAFAQRPELKQATNNIIIAQKLIKLASAGLAPSLGLVGSGNYNGEVSSGSDHGTLSLSAVLGIPLDDGGTTRSKVRAAQSDLRTQQITQAQLRQNVILEVIQALSNVSDAQTRSQSAGVGATAATEALRIANLRYQNGLGTILDVVNAQAQLATARTNQLNANYDYQTSLAQLTRAIGGR